MNKMKQLSILIFVLLTFVVSAQDKFIINDVRLFDGENVYENISVLVDNGIISKIIHGQYVDKSIKHIDGKGKTLIPALTNAHVHAWSPQSLKEAAKAGVLNLFDMHGVEQIQDMMRTYKDSTNYANYFAAGAAATAPEGHGTQYGFPTPTLSSPEEAKQFISHRIASKADYIKIIVEPWKKMLSHKTVKALIDEAHKQDKVVVVHISKVEDAYQVLNNNADGLVHIWWNAIIPEEQLQQLAKEKNFFVMPTLLTSIRAIKMIKTSSPDADFLSDEDLKAEVKRLYDAGITILAGTDPPNVQINFGDDLYKEMKLLAEAGISNIDVLKAATSNPILRFKLEKRGFIKENYIADMILIDGNPLENIEDIGKINTIWKSGKIVKRN